MQGIFLFFKPIGWTNKHILGFLKRTLNAPKLGHAGTLDPFAEGLMVVAVGRKFTRKLHTLLTASTKEYITTIELGASTDTFDHTGTITRSSSEYQPSLEKITTAIEANFVGERTQVPPVYSAKKIFGKRLRDIATKEEALALAVSRAKTVALHDYAIISYDYPRLVIRLAVSSGYYIRTFGSDLGTLLGTGAHLTALKRTRINGYLADDALSPDDLEHTLEVAGTFVGAVQGVGFRYFIQELAERYQLTGHARNAHDGSVSFVAQGNLQSISRFLTFVDGGPALTRIEDYLFVIRKPRESFPVFTVQ
ncbi:TPA: tRNA pseudouridine(55) synthase TruB [Candidatus Wolfebacteria bacterium]|nr:tRNA pseudouridine(55) synthase TruB [Candidatus Wolfebacteria bacterium]